MPFLQSRFRLCLLLFIPFLAIGCTSVDRFHFVKGPFDNKLPSGVDGFDFSQFHLDPAAAQMIKGKTLLVEVADPAKTLDMPHSRILDTIDWKAWQADCEETLANRLYQSGVFSDVGRAVDERPIKSPDLLFRMAITEYDEGYAFFRYFPGFGAGATRIQWEGELVALPPAGAAAQGASQPTPERRILAFADARRHPGGPSYGLSLKPYFGEALIAEDLSMAFDDLSDSFRDLTGVTTEESFFPHPRFRANLPPMPATPPPAPARPVPQNED